MGGHQLLQGLLVPALGPVGSGGLHPLVELLVGRGAALLGRLVRVGRLVGQLGLLLLKIFRIKENISLKYFFFLISP